MLGGRVVVDGLAATVDCKREKFENPAQSVHVGAGQLCGSLNLKLGTVDRPGRGMKGFGYAETLHLAVPGSEREECLVMHDHGKAGGRPPLVWANGTEKFNAPGLYAAMQELFPIGVYPSRVDVALDFDEALFDELVEYFTPWALKRNIKLDQRGDWVRGSDPERKKGDGRTLYLGSRESELYLRIYEYRLCHGYGPEVRVELEIKPAKRPQREELWKMGPVEMLMLHPGVRDLMPLFGFGSEDLRLYRGPVAPSTRERDLVFAATTLWPVLMRLSVDHLGDLHAVLEEVQRFRSEIERGSRVSQEKCPLVGEHPLGDGLSSGVRDKGLTVSARAKLRSELRQLKGADR